jgi:DNA-binding response OmpR family regulator
MIQPRTVLIANDQEWAARSIETVLVGSGYRVIRAFNGAQAVEQAIRNRPDACILDAQMPDVSGFEVARQLREPELLGPTVPMIITTAGPSSREARISAFDAGAWDFLPQPIDGDLLLLKLATYVDSKRQADLFWDQAGMDTSSGVYSAEGFSRRGEEILATARRFGQSVAVVLLTPSPSQAAAGLVAAVQSEQNVSAEYGAVLKRVTRAGDLVGKIGPLRFALVAQGAGDDGAAAIVRRWSEAMRDRPRSGLPELETRWVAVAQPADLTIDDLLGKAEASLVRPSQPQM